VRARPADADGLLLQCPGQVSALWVLWHWCAVGS
jgi:hypothetical protein